MCGGGGEREWGEYQPGDRSSPPPPQGCFKIVGSVGSVFSVLKYKALTFGDFGAWVLFKSVPQCGRIILVLKPSSHMASPGFLLSRL